MILGLSSMVDLLEIQMSPLLDDPVAYLDVRFH